MGMHAWMTKLAAVRSFLTGIENYIIAPTAWYYIRSLGQTKFFLALVLTSYNITSIFAGPLLGYLTDRLGSPRLIFNCCSVLKVVASVIYSVNMNEYFPLFGRLITGIASGAAAIILGQIVLQTDDDSRGKNFVFLEGVYCLGSAFGPGIGSFISFDVNILGWEINQGNSPGIVLAIIWLLFTIFSFFLPETIWAETGAGTTELRSNSSQSEDEERSTKVKSPEKKLRTMMDSRIFCLFFLIFTNMAFASTSTFYTPILAIDHLHLQPIHTKLLFLNCTMFTLLVFVCFHLASGYVDERRLFIVALSVQAFSLSFLTYMAFSWDQVNEVQYYILLLYVCLGMPYFAFPFGNSIISKITDPRYATFIQGLSYAVLNVAYIFSRVVASFVSTKTSLMYLSFGSIILWLVGMIWYSVLYKRMASND